MNKKIISILLSLCLIFTGCMTVSFASVAQKGFLDCEEHWAKSEIDVLVRSGIANGMGGNLFCPDSGITRAEFLAMVARAVKIEETKYSGVYNDVHASDWYAGILQAAYDNKIINSDMIQNGAFDGRRLITREEMTSIIIGGYNLLKGTFDTDYDISQFTDKAQISSWAESDVKKAVELGVVTGITDTEFRPQSTATRAQAAVMVFRLLNLCADNLLNGSFDTEDSSWTYTYRKGATTKNYANAKGTVALIDYDGYFNNGCIMYDVKYSGNWYVNALQWNCIFKNEDGGNVIENGKTYRLSFWAKLEGTDAFTISQITMRNRSNKDDYFSEIESVNLSGEGWRYYQLYLTAIQDKAEVKLEFWAGGEEKSNFKLYMDDFCLEESTQQYIPVGVACEEGFENIAEVSSGGAYIEGEEVQLSAATKPGMDYLFDTWVDAYGNEIEPGSLYTVKAEGNRNVTARFKPYKVQNKGFDVIPSGESPVAYIENVNIDNGVASISGGVSVPEGYDVVDCGALVYEGGYAGVFNLFTEGASALSPTEISEDGKFTVTVENVPADSKLLVRAYLICTDAEQRIYVMYSDKKVLLPTQGYERKKYNLLYNHELLVTLIKNADRDYNYFESYISEIASTDVDAVTCCPGIWRTLLWDSEVDTTLREPVHPNVTSVRPELERAKEYIFSGGDIVADTLKACREYGIDFIGSFRMNDYHYTDDKGWPTHNYFWQEHPEYWLYDSDMNYWQRLFNYMIPEVRDFYYSTIEEFVTLYDVDGIELDFQRSLMYFYPDEAEQGMRVMTDLVGKVRDLLDRVGKERGKYLQLSVRIPETLEECYANGLDPVTWDKLGYIDIANLSLGNFQSMEMDVEEFKSNLENSRVYAEMTWLTLQSLPARRFTTIENYYATAYNLFARGADGLSVFNIGWMETDKQPVINVLRGITDLEYLKKMQKHYVISKGHGTFPATTEKEVNIVIPDDTSSGIFNSSLFRVEMEKDCTAETIDVYINDVKLEETTRTDPELFAKTRENDTGYAELNQVKFYNVPLNVLKPGDNKFYIKVVSQNEAGQILSAELALYH